MKHGYPMQRLIDRQTALLRHMTSEAFIFGTHDLESATRDPELAGVDVGRLRLEAEFSYSKRMKRIRQTFARTAALLGRRFSQVTRDFASVSPPETHQRYLDAKRFFDRFKERWARDPSVPGWALDVAAIELTLAQARTLHPSAMEKETWASCPRLSSGSWYRIHPCVLLLRCRHDVRPLFEPDRPGDAVTERPTHMAVLAQPGRRRPMVMEVAPDAFMLLELSSDWLPLEETQPPNHSAADRTRHGALVSHLSSLGLLLLSGKHGRHKEHG